MGFTEMCKKYSKTIRSTFCVSCLTVEGGLHCAPIGWRAGLFLPTVLAQVLPLKCGRQAALDSHWLKDLGCSYLLAQVSPIACGRLPALGTHWMKGWLFLPIGPGLANRLWEASCTGHPLDERLGCSLKIENSIFESLTRTLGSLRFLVLC